MTPLREWTFRQFWHISALAHRAQWQEQTFQAALQGIKPGPEPDWGLGDQMGPRRPHYTETHEAAMVALKSDYAARNSDPDGRKFPGTL